MSGVFKVRPVRAEAFFWDGKSCEAIQAWLGDGVQFRGVPDQWEVYVPVGPHEAVWAVPGLYIVREPDGLIRAMRQDAFDRSWEAEPAQPVAEIVTSFSYSAPEGWRLSQHGNCPMGDRDFAAFAGYSARHGTAFRPKPFEPLPYRRLESIEAVVWNGDGDLAESVGAWIGMAVTVEHQCPPPVFGLCDLIIDGNRVMPGQVIARRLSPRESEPFVVIMPLEMFEATYQPMPAVPKSSKADHAERSIGVDLHSGAFLKEHP